MKRMVRVSLTIPEELKEALENLAKKEDRSFAYIMRRMVAEGVYHRMYKEESKSEEIKRKENNAAAK